MLKAYVSVLNTRAGFPEFVAGKQFQYFELGTREDAMTTVTSDYRVWASQAAGHALSDLEPEISKCLTAALHSDLVTSTTSDGLIVCVSIRTGIKCLTGR